MKCQLRHGNDLLTLHLLKGCDVSTKYTAYIVCHDSCSFAPLYFLLNLTYFTTMMLKSSPAAKFFKCRKISTLISVYFCTR